jgi:hypothetical protein
VNTQEEKSELKGPSGRILTSIWSVGSMAHVISTVGSCAIERTDSRITMYNAAVRTMFMSVKAGRGTVLQFTQ